MRAPRTSRARRPNSNRMSFWPHHTVAHVMEMTGRPEDGLGWMIGARGVLVDPRAHVNQVHIWWHKSLFHLELGQYDAALALYDGPMLNTQRPVAAQPAPTHRLCCGGSTRSAATSATAGRIWRHWAGSCRREVPRRSSTCTRRWPSCGPARKRWPNGASGRCARRRRATSRRPASIARRHSGGRGPDGVPPRRL